ncbi:MAG: DUF697 domain-containing protein [Stenomitos rutilans HA7619-LM2]|nr:DUF697 domain-containing protein [Stenomitos rutilans HA7619-LM2]
MIPPLYRLAMSVNLQRPLIIGAGLLALGAGSLELLHHVVGEWGLYAVFALLGAAGVHWLHKQADQKTLKPQKPLVFDAATVKRTLTEVKQVLTHLAAEVENPVEKVACTEAVPRVSRLQSQVTQLAQDLDRSELRFAVMGAKGSGKTALIQYVQSALGDGALARVQFNEVASFTATTTSGLTADILALQQALSADLVLFIVTGDITESELQTVKRIAASKRTVLVFNKMDQFLPIDRQTVLEQLRIQVGGVLTNPDVVAIATAPQPIKVRQHQPDGAINEWLEDQPPQLADLTQRLEHILAQERQQLVLASSLNHAIALKTQAKTVLNDVRRTRAMPVVEQFQWIAAGTAFASPLPTLDVLATAAINAQMILDLGTLYRQKFSLQQAQKMAATLGSLMLKLGLVELSTQTIAGLLKVNALTYVAGGCIQGVSAAYLTRIVGLSLIEYFDAQEPNLTLTEASPLAIERFSQIVQSVFQKNHQLAFLQDFVWQAMERVVSLSSSKAPSELTIEPLPAELFIPVESFLPAEPVSAAPLAAEPLRLPLKPASASNERQEVKLLDENGSSVRLSVASLDSTSIASN